MKRRGPHYTTRDATLIDWRSYMKHLAALLCALMFILSVPFAAHAADDTVYTEGTLYYTIGEETVTIVGCFGRKTEVTVPASIAGYPVNTIASGAFTTNRYLEQLNLPDTITAIGEGAIAEGIHVIYNANTDHPQDVPTDIITGREPIYISAKSDDSHASQSSGQTLPSDDDKTSEHHHSVGDQIVEADVDADDEEVSPNASAAGSAAGSASNSSAASSDNSSAVSAANDAVSGAAESSSAASSETKDAQKSDGTAATSDETGGGNIWIFVVIAVCAAVAAGAGFAFFAIRKKKMSAK